MRTDSRKVILANPILCVVCTNCSQPVAVRIPTSQEALLTESTCQCCGALLELDQVQCQANAIATTARGSKQPVFMHTPNHDSTWKLKLLIVE
jgi:MinD superfamily P-loop ATPase